MRMEICVDSVEGALAAERGGAHRVELCQNLFEGGTTPSAGTIRIVRQNLQIGLHVLIRPRPGDFLYTPTELDVIRADIAVAKECGADGIAVGCLTAAGDVDIPMLSCLMEWARPMSITFHRAFDMCRNPEEALETLIRLGVERVLTSGQESSCLEGSERIASLQRQAQNRIVLVAAGGITPANARRIIEATGVREIHLSARGTVESRMQHRNLRAFMGGALRPPEFSWKSTDEFSVRQVRDLFPPGAK